MAVAAYGSANSLIVLPNPFLRLCRVCRAAVCSHSTDYSLASWDLLEVDNAHRVDSA